MNANLILKRIQPDLERVQTCFDGYLDSSVGIVDQLGRYVARQSGKKLRPALLILAGRMIGCEPERLYPLGALVELIHTASLVHDDIIDEADTRRGSPSVNAAYGNHMSVLLGDWLYMTAFQVGVAQQNFRILDVLLDVSRKMVEGELIQADVLGRLDLTAEASLDIAARKTAHLFSAATALPAVSARADDATIDRLTRIGLNLGLAFQVVDDVLDYTADEQKLGKPVMGDLREGKLTLPVIYLLQSDGAAARRMVETVVAEQGFTSVQPDALLRELRRAGCLERTMACAHAYADQARTELLTFPSSPHRKTLVQITDFILKRQH